MLRTGRYSQVPVSGCRHDRNALAQMRALLWPDTGVEENLRELDAVLSHPMTGTLPMAILVSEDENGALIGFLEVGLRLTLTAVIPRGQSGSWKAGLSKNNSATGGSAGS